MAEPNLMSPTQPQPQPAPVPEPTPEPQKVDLVTRVSQVAKPEPVPQPEPEPEAGNPFGITKEDHDKVKSDPVLSKFYNSMRTDYLKKTGEVAEQRKAAEKLQSDFSTWDATKVSSVLKDPNFVQAAQTYMQTQKPSNFQGSQEDWSALSDTEKASIEKMDNRLLQLEQQNHTAQVKQQDTELKTKYANYDSSAMDVLTADLLAGKLQATREHLWKVHDYDDAVNRAYQLGLQDKKLDVTDKLNSTTIDGVTTQTSSDRPVPQEGESDRDFLTRVFDYNRKQATLTKRT